VKQMLFHCPADAARHNPRQSGRREGDIWLDYNSPNP
jgi:hypothetical protein